MNSQTTFERVVAAAFALSAVVVAAVVVTVAVRREFFPPAQDPSESITEPIPVDNWEELIASGHRDVEGSPATDGAMALPLTPWDSVPEVRLAPELRIDGASAGLTRIGTVAVAGDGSMVVSQPGTSSLVVFDAEGVRLGRFGRRGGGVGEIGSVARSGWKGDTVWVYDLVQERLVYGTLPARVVRTAPLSRDAVPERSRAEILPAAFSGIVPLALYADGSIYASSIVPGEPAEPPVSPTVRRYVRINPAGQVSRIVAEVPEALYVRMETAVGRYGSRVPFLRGGLHGVSPGGDYVATVRKHIEGDHGGTFDVILQESRGDTVYARTYPFVGVPIPPALADSVIEARAAQIESRAMARLFREEAPVPPVYPPVSYVVAGSDGTVWVGLRPTEDERSHLVLDPRGTPLGVSNLPDRMRVVAADSVNAWVVERDPSGVESVVRYRAGEM